MIRESWQRIGAIAVKEFIHLSKDWGLPLFMLIGGVMELTLIGWATGRPISNLPLMLLDHDHSPQSREVIQAVQNTGTFKITDFALDEDQITEAIRKGQINAALIIPEDYSDELLSANGQPVLVVILSGAESVPATAALRALEGLVRSIDSHILFERYALDADTLRAFEPSLRVWFNEALSEALYTIPAEMALMLEFTVLLFAALSFSRERELGTLEQLLVMPFSSMELIIGKAIPVIIVGFSDFTLMLIMVHFLFNIPIRGSLILLLLLALVYLLVELSKGMVISVISKTQHQAFLTVMVIGFVDFMFTGYAIPVESMPLAMRWIANLIPAHHWLAIVRGILLKGSGLTILWPHVLILAILAVVIVNYSLRFVHRALD